MNYTIIGAGGIGGVIGAYLAASGRDVTLIARGDHLKAIQENGLTAHTQRRGDLLVKNIRACSTEDDFGKCDVAFVCVKGYSLMETVPILKKAAHEKTVVIPILNSLKAGKKLAEVLPALTVLDGCIYTSSFVSAPGEITQPSPLFRIVFGPRKGQEADQELLERIARDLGECEIDSVLSPDIERDVFKKFAFISAFASAGSYFDVASGILQKDGEERDTFISLLKELQDICTAKKINMDTDFVADSIKLMDGLAPDITSSMHKDVSAGKNFEKQELIFDVVELAKELGVPAPGYMKVALHFGYQA